MIAKYKLIIKNPIKTKAILILASLLFTSVNATSANPPLDLAIQKQIESANDCEKLAQAAELTSLDAEDVFSQCVSRRAISIAMLLKYGIGQSGKINAFEKIEAYSYLIESPNPLVQREAEKFSTAAGPR